MCTSTVVGVSKTAPCFWQALGEPLYRVSTGNYEYRLILRCRQEARTRFAKMRKDVLEKIELLDQKHGECHYWVQQIWLCPLCFSFVPAQKMIQFFFAEGLLCGCTQDTSPEGINV